MKYLYNTHLQPNGVLPPDKWIECHADSREAALQIACNTLKLSDLPCTVHVADSSPLHPNGVPMITHGYDLEAKP